jgi:hypothetical protein
MGAINTGFDTVNLHRPTLESRVPYALLLNVVSFM